DALEVVGWLLLTPLPGLLGEIHLDPCAIGLSSRAIAVEEHPHVDTTHMMFWIDALRSHDLGPRCTEPHREPPAVFRVDGWHPTAPLVLSKLSGQLVPQQRPSA